MKKIVSLVLSLVLVSSLFTPCLAVDVSGGTGNSQAVVNQESTQFSVTVPSSLPISVDSVGQVTVADNVKIVNNSYGPIKVSNISIESVSPWVLTAYDKDFSKAKIGLKEYGLVINGDKTTPQGSLILTDANWPSIDGKSELGLSYNGNLGIQKDAITNENIANVVFTIEWYTSDIKYVLAQDSDFSGEPGENFQYIGTDKYVEVPHVIKGVPITSYASMFVHTSVEGVKSTNPNITHMNWMFGSSKATSLDLSNLDTSNVISMYAMFNKSAATTLDLSGFNTSKVADMERMFEGSKATTLDLSSFYTTTFTDIRNMFLGSVATTGYARTQSDANRLNASSGKPTSLTFIVKKS